MHISLTLAEYHIYTCMLSPETELPVMANHPKFTC